MFINELLNAKAFLFDVNGTMVNDMPYHISAWHKKITQLGGNLSLDEMKVECYGKNDELLERIFPGKYSMEEKIQLGNEKEAIYRMEFLDALKLMDGLSPFLATAFRQKIKMGIGSAAMIENIDFVLDNLKIRHYFEAIVSANHVVQSKPHPETFLKCANLIGIEPENCIVFEDSPKGVECALNAGIKTIVLLGVHNAADFMHFPNVLKCVPNYHSLLLSDTEFRENEI
jgi:hypothetical protein